MDINNLIKINKEIEKESLDNDGDFFCLRKEFDKIKIIGFIFWFVFLLLGIGSASLAVSSGTVSYDGINVIYFFNKNSITSDIIFHTIITNSISLSILHFLSLNIFEYKKTFNNLKISIFNNLPLLFISFIMYSSLINVYIDFVFYLSNFFNIEESNFTFFYHIIMISSIAIVNFSYLVYIFCYKYKNYNFLFNTKNEQKNYIYQFYKRKYKKINQSKLYIIDNINSIEDYLFFKNIVDKENLKYIRSFYKGVEDKLIKDTAFDNYSDYETFKLNQLREINNKRIVNQ